MRAPPACFLLYLLCRCAKGLVGFGVHVTCTASRHGKHTMLHPERYCCNCTCTGSCERHRGMRLLTPPAYLPACVAAVCVRLALTPGCRPWRHVSRRGTTPADNRKLVCTNMTLRLARLRAVPGIGMDRRRLHSRHSGLAALTSAGKPYECLRCSECTALQVRITPWPSLSAEASGWLQVHHA